MTDCGRLYSRFDGIDVDWEYPVGGGVASNSVDERDWENYVVLLKDMRDAMDAKWPTEHKELTIAMGMGEKISGDAPRKVSSAWPVPRTATQVVPRCDLAPNLAPNLARVSRRSSARFSTR